MSAMWHVTWQSVWRVLRVPPQVLCIVIGCCYFVARRRSDMKVPSHRKSHLNIFARAAALSCRRVSCHVTHLQGLKFAQFDDSSAQAGTSFAIPARDLTLTRFPPPTRALCDYAFCSACEQSLATLGHLLPAALRQVSRLPCMLLTIIIFEAKCALCRLALRRTIGVGSHGAVWLGQWRRRSMRRSHP